MKLFTRREENPLAALEDGSFWPDDDIDDVDDAEFAAAIAEGRLAEQRSHGELVDA